MRSQEEYEPTKTELFAEDWWRAHGYSVRLVERVASKSTYEIQRGEKKHRVVIPLVVLNREKYLRDLENQWV